MTETDAQIRFVRWLDSKVLMSGRGDSLTSMANAPRNRLWLGRITSEAAVINSPLGDRGERLEPCAIGIRVLPASTSNLRFEVTVRCCVWLKQPDTTWRKTALLEETVEVQIAGPGSERHGRDQLTSALTRLIGEEGLSCEVRTELEQDLEGRYELTVLVVNTSPQDHPQLADTTLYQVSASVADLATRPYMLESLPDSFRYDRRIEAYGVNGGFDKAGNVFTTTDTVVVERGRPRYWNAMAPEPDLRFSNLAHTPLPPLEELADALDKWGVEAWSDPVLLKRASRERWSPEMLGEARQAATEFTAELVRVRAGVSLLKDREDLRQAFIGMNKAISRSSRGRYDRWRPFQIGFLLANISCLTNVEEESAIADVVWFATGGGKTETYLGLVVTAALFDRIRGKASGVTAWSRFPLRMLSLQQTQRFADAMAAAELVRRQMKLDGDPFSVGFLVGNAATPNTIKLEPGQGDPDADDPQMPERYRILLRCPFCGNESMSMGFDRRLWRLEHRCGSAKCPWPERGLPFFIVDDELYRFLPTVVVGTLDKAATIAMQPSMRGLVGMPWGRCSVKGHGFLYAPRSKRPSGCLVPECSGHSEPLIQDSDRFPPTLRLQDELHLLKDSLGAVDAHYEALFDHLQRTITGTRAKILGSSATLTGYKKQIEVLYARQARVFPAAGPSATEGFWTSESGELARRFVALSPRGATIEYAVDQTATTLQLAIRELISRPGEVCAELGVPETMAERLINLYGVDVVYGNTLRDLEAVSRSFETQIRVTGQVQHATLTGRTPFDEVRNTLERLEKPEPNFDDRLHLVAASSMMSHGVDIDRLNVLAIVGMPLTTAEFIQTSSRVGRRYPGLVFVVLKMARERDAGVFRSFESFVRQGDRFVEPVPITRRSRRVLTHTIAGLFFARLRQIHEPNAGKALTTTSRLRDYYRAGHLSMDSEYEALCDALGLTSALDDSMRGDIRIWLERYFQALERADGAHKFPDDLSPDKPMTSLRDVEEQAPIFGTVRT